MSTFKESWVRCFYNVGSISVNFVISIDCFMNRLWVFIDHDKDGLRCWREAIPLRNIEHEVRNRIKCLAWCPACIRNTSRFIYNLGQLGDYEKIINSISPLRQFLLSELATCVECWNRLTCEWGIKEWISPQLCQTLQYHHSESDKQRRLRTFYEGKLMSEKSRSSFWGSLPKENTSLM